jgi:hypothetical protein
MCTVRALGNRQPSVPAVDIGVNFELILAGETALWLARRVHLPMDVFSAGRRNGGRGGVSRADRGGVRRTRSGSEIGRAAVNYQNAVGLVLSILIALYLAGALLFPERF